MLSETEEFWNHVEKTSTCWNWLGGATLGETAVCWWEGAILPAREVCWSLLLGGISDDVPTKPACGNYLCVYPDHMYSLEAPVPGERPIVRVPPLLPLPLSATRICWGKFPIPKAPPARFKKGREGETVAIEIPEPMMEETIDVVEPTPEFTPVPIEVAASELVPELTLEPMPELTPEPLQEAIEVPAAPEPTPIAPRLVSALGRPQPTLVRTGVWMIPSPMVPDKLFCIQETRFSLVCDCPSPRARCWHIEEVERMRLTKIIKLETTTSLSLTVVLSDQLYEMLAKASDNSW